MKLRVPFPVNDFNFLMLLRKSAILNHFQILTEFSQNGVFSKKIPTIFPPIFMFRNLRPHKI